MKKEEKEKGVKKEGGKIKIRGNGRKMNRKGGKEGKKEAENGERNRRNEKSEKRVGEEKKER